MSFDYYYNYFHPSNKNDLTKNIEQSCLTLGFYLASWGMFRGSSFMLKKSAKHFESLVNYIASLPDTAWHIDANNFKGENIDFLIYQYNHIKEILIPCNNHSNLTLVTKIMLGVFASVSLHMTVFLQTVLVKFLKAGVVLLFLIKNHYRVFMSSINPTNLK